jgi:hypothetical protein
MSMKENMDTTSYKNLVDICFVKSSAVYESVFQGPLRKEGYLGLV